MTSSLRLKPYLIALCLFCLLPQLSSLLFRKEIFPWTSFPMYSGVDTGTNLILLSAYVVDENGKEQAIERTSILRPKYEYRSRVNAEKAWDRPLNLEEKEVLELFSEIFKTDLKNQDKSYYKVRFYFEYWKKFSGPQRYNPDERRLIYEHSLR